MPFNSDKEHIVPSLGTARSAFNSGHVDVSLFEDRKNRVQSSGLLSDGQEEPCLVISRWTFTGVSEDQETSGVVSPVFNLGSDHGEAEVIRGCTGYWEKNTCERRVRQKGRKRREKEEGEERRGGRGEEGEERREGEERERTKRNLQQEYVPNVLAIAALLGFDLAIRAALEVLETAMSSAFGRVW